MKKTILKIGGTVLVLALVYGIHYLYTSLPILTAYTAKNLCSCAFITDRSEESILDELKAQGLVAFEFVKTQVDRQKQEVHVNVLGLASRTAIYRERIGCTLVIDTDADFLRSQFDPSKIEPIDYKLKDSIFINSHAAKQEVGQHVLGQVLDEAFSEPSLDAIRGTRAVIVLQNGKAIVERYADGFSQDTPLIGWSMTKSVTNALVGILVKQGKMSLDDQALFAEWQSENDPRREITLDMLLRMSSGLDFTEEYGRSVDATEMFFNRYDAANLAINKKLKHKPDSVWYYSSGTTNTISKYIRNTIGGSIEEYFSFPQRELFNKLGIQSAVMEPDPSGTFVSSSFMYATARDWARLGQLYLQDGIWNGERILPEGWVNYSSTLTPSSKKGFYGAHFWMDRHGQKWPDLPKDLYYMSGFQGQSVTIIPSKKLVIVRLGQSKNNGFNYGEFVGQIVVNLE